MKTVKTLASIIIEDATTLLNTIYNFLVSDDFDLNEKLFIVSIVFVISTIIFICPLSSAFAIYLLHRFICKVCDDDDEKLVNNDDDDDKS